MSTTVMPFKIFIAKTKNILTAASSAKLFDRDGNPVVSMTERPIISKSVCTEMDEALYCVIRVCDLVFSDSLEFKLRK